MSNMSYCRFQNTLPDLIDCMDALDDIGRLDLRDELSNEEYKAALRLLDVCKDIYEEHIEGWDNE